MALRKFLQENHSNLNQDNGDGYGRRLFAIYKDQLGDMAEKYIHDLIENFIVKKDIFSSELLHQHSINQIKFILARLESEISTIALELNLKLDQNEIARLKGAYQFAFISRFNLYAKDPSLQEKNIQILGLMKVINKISDMLVKNKEDEILTEARKAFDQTKKLLLPHSSTEHKNEKKSARHSTSFAKNELSYLNSTISSDTKRHTLAKSKRSQSFTQQDEIPNPPKGLLAKLRSSMNFGDSPVSLTKETASPSAIPSHKRTSWKRQ